MIWLLVCLLGMAGILLLVSYFCFRFAIRAGRINDYSIWEKAETSIYRDFHSQIYENAIWADQAAYEQVFVKSFDGLMLSARYYPGTARVDMPYILLFHGYHSVGRTDFGDVLRFYHQKGYHVLLVDERGHGLSQGKYIGFGVLERRDCLSWIQYLQARFGQQISIFLEGASMGASTVLMACGLPLPGNICGVIADCGFTSPWEILRHVLRSQYHLPPFPLLWLMDLWARLLAGYSLKEASTPEALKHTQIPVLFLHGKADRLVPCEMTLQAYEACVSPKYLCLVEKAFHCGSYLLEKERCQKELEQFLRRYANAGAR
jgi:pimeloyl-ACP methyl ester carboxylesterase